MFSFSFTRLILAVIVCSCLTAGCVGKAKYYNTMQEEASAKSELGIVKMDLGDARAEVGRQEALVTALRDEIVRLDNSVTELYSQNKSAQVQIGASLNKTQVLLEQTQVELDLASKQLTALKNYHTKREERLKEVTRRLSGPMNGLPVNQVSTTLQNDEAVVLRFGEGLFFIQKGSTFSDYGNALIQGLSTSLSGQPDLLIDVVAYPIVSAGTIKSWESASGRANTIAFAMVSEYGLSPKQVSATGQQGDVVIMDGAPAESKQQKTVELVIRLNPSFYPKPILGR